MFLALKYEDAVLVASGLDGAGSWAAAEPHMPRWEGAALGAQAMLL